MNTHGIKTFTAASSVAVLLALSACDQNTKGVAEAQQDVQQAQQQAPQQVAQAQLEAEKTVIEARQEAIENQQKAREEARKEVEDAQQALQKAQQDVEKAQQRLQQAQAKVPQEIQQAQQEGQQMVQEARKDAQQNVQQAQQQAQQAIQEARKDLQQAQAERQERQADAGAANSITPASQPGTNLMGAAPASTGSAASPSPAPTNPVDDAQITAKVNTGLSVDKRLSASGINVDTKGGVVTLQGSAPTEAAKQQAAEIARHVEGVQSVDNQLRVSQGLGASSTSN